MGGDRVLLHAPTAPSTDEYRSGHNGPLGTIAVELLFPFHHVALAPVFFDQLVDMVAALAAALRAFDAQHVELTLDVTEHEIGPRHGEPMVDWFGCLLRSGQEYRAKNHRST